MKKFLLMCAIALTAIFFISIPSRAAESNEIKFIDEGNGFIWCTTDNFNVDSSVNGLVKYNGKWLYFENGYHNNLYSGLAKNKFGWWYVKNGKLDLSHTGIACNKYGKWFVKKGKLDLTYTGFAKEYYTDYYDTVYSRMAYVIKGKVNTKYSAMVKTARSWVYVENGYYSPDYTGFAKNQYGYWYFNNGRINTKYTGFVSNKYGEWYVVKGKIAKNFTGVIKYSGLYYYIRNGKFYAYTGNALYNKIPVRMKDGYLYTGFSGLIKSGGQWYFLNKGIFDNTFSALVKYGSNYYQVEKGRIAYRVSPSDFRITAYKKMIAFKSEYYEGRHYDNDDYYIWKGGYYSTGYGCAGFAFMLSDAVFGSAPMRFVYDCDFEDVRVGDILRVYSDTHSVIVLETRSDGFIVAEGNYNRSVHWGRFISKSEYYDTISYVITRY